MNQGLYGMPKQYGPLFLYRKWDAFAPDESPHSLSSEFTNPNDLAKFTRVNIDGVTNLSYDVAQTSGKGLYLNIPNHQYRFRSFMLPFPNEAEYSIYASCFPAVTGSGSLLCLGGVMYSTTAVTNSGSQYAIAVGSLSDPHHHRARIVWANYGETASGAGSNDYGIQPAFHMRFRQKGGVHYQGFSIDGEHYHEGALAIGFTPGYFGLYAQNYIGADLSTTNELSVTWPYLRYYRNGDRQFRTGRMVSIYR